MTNRCCSNLSDSRRREREKKNRVFALRQGLSVHVTVMVAWRNERKKEYCIERISPICVSASNSYTERRVSKVVLYGCADLYMFCSPLSQRRKKRRRIVKRSPYYNNTAALLLDTHAINSLTSYSDGCFSPRNSSTSIPFSPLSNHFL